VLYQRYAWITIIVIIVTTTDCHRPYREKKERGSETAVSNNPLFEQVAAVAEDSHFTLDVEV
jgi:hypothetical protein